MQSIRKRRKNHAVFYKCIKKHRFAVLGVQISSEVSIFINRYRIVIQAKILDLHLDDALGSDLQELGYDLHIPSTDSTGGW